MRFRGRRRRDAASAPLSPTDAELASQVDEGLLIVRAGLRLATRNRIVLGAMRDHADYDEAALLAGVRADASVIVAEQRALIARLATIRARVAGRRGAPEHGQDFRGRDVVPLERRERIAALLVERLEAEVGDDERALAVVHAARRGALEDMFDQALRSLRDAPHVVDSGHRHRLRRLRDDLRALGPVPKPFHR